jgi:hypothetical protein
LGGGVAEARVATERRSPIALDRGRDGASVLAEFTPIDDARWPPTGAARGT